VRFANTIVTAALAAAGVATLGAARIDRGPSAASVARSTRAISADAALRVLPIVSLPMEETGQRMQERSQREAAGVSATIGPGPAITLRATAAARVPVTGANGAGAEHYGNFVITRVDVPAGGDVTIPLRPPGDGSGDGDAVGHPLGAAGGASSSCGCRTVPAARDLGLDLLVFLLACAAALLRGRPRGGGPGARTAA